ncbi:MAG TPA: TonB-dependent receptor plug domain-containing protein, partial [Pyrinomonadaceae bacterium]|nr:TonB-dependent receptor plug domain-containing protein [Pyrinomonadaceae bacterium]
MGHCHQTLTRRACALALCLFALAATGAAQETRVAGVVLDQAGAAVAGAQVSLRPDGARVAAETTTTDAAGRFTFAAVEPRAGFVIVVRARGFAPVEQRWPAAALQAAPLAIRLAPAPLDEAVTVTAARIETRLGETAASVVVLSAAELRATAAVTLDDALRQVAGFSLFRRAGSRTANPTTQGVSLRGVGASGASRAVVLVDGVPLSDPFGGWVYWGRVPRETITSVEVLRGGASALYGGGALGGVVNVRTRRTEAPALALELAYGNEQSPDASLYVGGSRGRWGAQVGAEFFHTDGYVLLDEHTRGRADTPAGARHADVDLTLERKLDDAARLFVRAAFFGEARTNGTPLQTNRTHIRQLSAGGDWPTSRIGTLTLRLYGGTQVFDQNFSAVAADRNS